LLSPRRFQCVVAIVSVEDVVTGVSLELVGAAKAAYLVIAPLASQLVWFVGA